MIYGYLVTGKLFNPENYYNNTDLDLTVRYNGSQKTTIIQNLISLSGTKGSRKLQ